MNKAIVTGRVKEEPILKKLQGGHRVARLDIENVELFTDSMEQEKEKLTRFRVEGWNGMADLIMTEIKKEDTVLVEGSFNIEKFTIQGQPKIKYYIKADKIERK